MQFAFARDKSGAIGVNRSVPLPHNGLHLKLSPFLFRPTLSVLYPADAAWHSNVTPPAYRRQECHSSVWSLKKHSSSAPIEAR